MKLHASQKAGLIEQRIEILIANFTTKNKAECLESIMSLEPEYRLKYLNIFIIAVNTLGEEAMVDLLSAA
ncbi:hypothetical protein ADP71_28770 [Vitreoscilla sp. C1]|uniref:hypothetical protein n=1 Tax=Vitreoscilla sp. (strain C1) TaxID=96942 RepID=UPI00148ED64C|nr:hypothetical protein [Vitreoscilla sp. C1]AUZ06111.2 hypothetical protein ADP71_28770 [Vitreoscilla sp. C1]